MNVQWINMKFLQSYVIETDGTKRPMTKDEFRNLQKTIAFVPIAISFCVYILGY